MKKKMFTILVVVLIVTVVAVGVYLKKQDNNQFTEEIPILVENPVYQPEPEPPAVSAPVTIFSADGSSGENAIQPTLVQEPPVTSPTTITTPTAPVAPPPVVKPQPRSAALEARRGVISGSGVNFRSTPELQLDNANRVGQAAKGTRVELLEKKREADGGPHYWYRIRLPDGREGWVRDDLIKIEE